jgi:Zn-dependent protease with chaperone function
VDFFARQEQSRRTSRALVGLFLLAFIVVALVTTAVIAIALRLYMENNALFLGTETWQQWLAAHGRLVAVVAFGTLGLMTVASLLRAATLARGGGQVARMLGGKKIGPDAAEPLERRLVNVVEEIALASGLPVPEIYVLEQEAQINAFAAGRTPTDAAVAVTRGALERLDRAELQGVIAHEFSHILNGDMRLNQQLIGLSFGILVLALVGRWLLRGVRYSGARRGRKSGGIAAAVAIGVALTIIGGIGVFLSRLIKAGVSRHRERLADAAAVQFTREPQGLAGALKKIGGYGARIVSVDTEEVAHMLFERGARPLTRWLATHPPLLERIRALEPEFDPRDLPKPGAPLPEPSAAAGERTVTAAFAGAAVAASPLDRIGEIAEPAEGRALLKALPDEVYEATRSRDASLLVALALALSPTEATRRRQLALIEQQLGATRAARCGRLFEELAGAGSTEGPAAMDGESAASARARLRLPVLELALPTLRQRPAEQLRYLLTLLARLQELEPAPRLFDFVLLRIVEAYLRSVPGMEPSARRSTNALDARAATRTLLRNVAAFGHDDAARARSAYEAGIAALGWPHATTEPFEPPAAARDLRTLDAALAALASVPPRAKQRVLEAVLATIRSDAVTAVEERELFRLIAASLECPVPPDITL